MAFLPGVGSPAWLMQIFFTASTVFSGFNMLGVIKCTQMVDSSAVSQWPGSHSSAAP